MQTRLNMGVVTSTIALLSLLVAPSLARAASPKVIFLTSGSTWTVPSDWNNSSNTIECIGAGGTGGINSAGAGGAYAKRSNVSLTPGQSVSYAVGSSTTTFFATGSDTWFNSTSTLECAGGGSGGASHGDVTYAGGAGGSGGSTHNGPGGGGAAGPHGNGANGASTTGSNDPYAGAGGAGDNGNAAGGAGGANAENYQGGNVQGGNGSSEVVWTQTSNGAVAGPGGGGGGSGSGFPNVADMGGAGGLYGGGSGAPGRGSPDVSSNTAGEPGIIVITYTPSAGGGGGGGVAGTTTYAYDANGRLTCTATPDGHFTSYTLDPADNRTQVTTNTSSCAEIPIAGPANATVAINSTNDPITLTLSGGAATSVAVPTSPSHGTVSISGTSISYTPTSGYSGPDSFQYTASNAAGTSSPATVSITVSAFQTGDVPVQVGENTSGNLIMPDVVGGTAASLAVSTPPSHGAAGVSGTDLTYTPTTGFYGSDSFQYTATSTAGQTSAPGTVYVTVVQPPVANAYSAPAVAYGSSANPINPTITGGTPTKVTVSSAANGQAAANGLQITYKPNTGFPAGGHNGTDSFQYTAYNVGGNSTATISITVNPQPVTANPVSGISVTENSSANSITPSFSGGTPTGVIVSTNASNGTATASGLNISYTPNPGYSGSDSFQYKATNDAGTSAAATVSLNVSASGPTAEPDSMTVHGQVIDGGGGAVQPISQGCINPLTNDISPLGYPLYVASVTQPTGNWPYPSTSFTSTSVCYTVLTTGNVPDADTFTYTVSDGHGGSSTATVTVNFLYP